MRKMKKLNLNRETLRDLDVNQVQEARGGVSQNATCTCPPPSNGCGTRSIANCDTLHCPLN